MRFLILLGDIPKEKVYTFKKEKININLWRQYPRDAHISLVVVSIEGNINRYIVKYKYVQAEFMKQF